MNKGHHYEVSLYGVFSPVDLKAILDRMTLHSESSAPLHLREVVFDPLVRQADAAAEQGILQAQKDMTDANASWVLYSYLKAESSRVYPEAMVRPWAICHVMGDGLGFAAALGYIRRSEIYKRGFVFRRDGLVIQIFQIEHVDSKTRLSIPAHVDSLWKVEVKTAAPVRNTQELPLVKNSIAAILEVQLMMKGLLDLRREDILAS
ncbi:hypothetical protein BD626DRAFT_481732 [Schizophyllum amplum]|uniref:Mediator of RNA polymerase II transcription subunit 18 n=1 Tax=Schizophyllum amplum TaxID=97359 RepID=A0A550CUI3_9AGAR|nr:hypothetical protein BD626DRAFT_481732 [Auriculariopsis ampla]